ncbi:ATP-binding cassette domain-containing protein [Maribacter hydrothermalis]|uniref:UvrABC system protein A n=1 Tax=Maribacter hydrothermalis TaxID=1836467 RepID=A0A1B7Z6J5_9FLAO|nr:excinuclease ABC subunit UvrA [Maribacter hydrothermalis]APQ18759.1 daunorubicin resistance protein DrrC [Maribacter hydrothermalis]OBR38160.1 daunorubicin resistance protein DrrC [Maribacter hydrothermalis]
MKKIKIYGARQNNLKNLSLEIPKNKITVFTGVSGSGKSSLVFETIGAEAQRQINETQNSFVRNRLMRFGVADVDKIEHLNVPVIINQKRLGGNARSTVGTSTDIYATLRLLFSRVGKPFVGYSNVFSFNHPQGMCSTCNGLGYVTSIDTNTLFDRTKSLNEGAIQFPTFQPNGYRWLRYVNSGYFDNDKKLKDYTEEEWNLLLHSEEHKPKNPSKDWGKTMQYLGVLPRIQRDFLNKNSKEEKLRKKELRKIISTEVCPECSGKRLNGKILSCKINGKAIADCTSLSIDDLLSFIQTISSDTYETVINELTKKLQNLVTIGLQYLTLDRVTTTLSGGESQRIKMVKHLGNSLEDLLYIFDEPSIGLHPKDLDNISKIIKQIKAKGNTVLIVEHDPDLIKLADHVVDLGPLSGVNGGEIVYQGNFENLKKSKGKTGQYFSLSRQINKNPREFSATIKITDADLYNLKNVSVEIPKNVLTVVTGVAGSGKSTLISKVLPKQFPKAKIIDQSQIRGSSKSNLLTYLGVSDKIRRLFSKANDVSIKLFSSNSEGGCENCKGLGVEKIDLAFMDDIEAPCEVCGGSGFKPQVLKYTYRNKNIVEVLDLTTLEARSFFDQNDFATDFDLLIDLGLDYLKLGQRLSGFSGGERQRLKLTKEIDNEDNLIVLDEPSTGLHPFDTKKLMSILNKLVNQNNTIIVIEHNLDIISKADWIIDVGEGAGKYGGEIIFEGTVEKLLNHKNSATAEYLRKYLEIKSR